MLVNMRPFIFSLLFALQVLAVGEVIPPLKTREEIQQYAIAIRRQLPFGTDVDRTINIQLNGVAALRKQFPDYDKWMLEKPDPLTFEIFTTSTEKSSVPVLRHEVHQYINMAVAALFQDESAKLAKSLSDVKKLSQLQARALEILRDSLLEMQTPTRGLFTGLATILPANEKGTYFKLGDIQQQLQFLENLHISDEDLRKSSFRAETIGLNSVDVTYQQVLEVARKRVKAVNKVFIALSYFKTLQKTSEYKSLTTLDATDFDFALKNSSDFITEVLELLNSKKSGSVNSKNLRYADLISNFQDSFSRLQFSFETRDLVKKELFGTVYEVHPHLGVHRGCIGGDCSTSRSPMFPYSPWEHVFYIKNKEGGFAGYVSATRVVSKGLSSFYVKDISGSNLSPELAEAVLIGFNKVHSYYGSERLLIATPEFTNGQNHFPLLKAALGRFNSRGEKVEVEFPDKEVRTFIGKSESTFASTSAYDSVEVHKRAIVFPDKVSPTTRYEYSSKKGTLPSLEPKTQAELILEALQHISIDRRMNYTHFPWLNRRDLELAQSLIRNDYSHKIAEHHEQLKNYFTNLGLAYNRNFQEKYAPLLQTGILAAPDAFTVRNKTLVAETEKLWIRMAKLHKNYASFMPVGLQNLSTLQNSPRFQDLISLYKDRLQPHDILQLALFASKDHEESQKILRDPKNKAAIESALLYFFTTPFAQTGLDDLIAKRSFGFQAVNLFTLVDGRERKTYEIVHLIESGLQAYGLTPQNLSRSGELRNTLDRIALKATDAFTHENRAANLKRFSRRMDAGKLEQFEVLNVVKKFRDLDFGLTDKGLQKLIEARVRQLNPLKNEVDLFELATLQFLGSVEASKALQNPDIRPLYLNLLNNSASGQVMQFTSELQTALTRTTNYRNHTSTHLVQLAQRMLTGIDGNTTIKSASSSISSIQSMLNISFDEITKIPALASDLSRRWVRMADAFTSADSAIIRFSLNLLFEGARADALEAVSWNRLLSQIKYLNQKKDFHIFIEKLTEAFVDKGCDPCAVGLIQIHLLGYTKNEIQMTPQLIQRLISHKSSNLMTYGAYLALKTNLPIQLSSSQIEKIAKQAERAGTSTTPALRGTIQEMAMYVLTHTRSQNAQAQQILISMVRNEPINIIALKAGLAYIAHGGSAYVARLSLTRHYDREELKENLDDTQTKLYNEFLTSTKPGFGSGTFYGLECSFLFVPR